MEETLFLIVGTRTNKGLYVGVTFVSCDTMSGEISGMMTRKSTIRTGVRMELKLKKRCEVGKLPSNVSTHQDS